MSTKKKSQCAHAARAGNSSRRLEPLGAAGLKSTLAVCGLKTATRYTQNKFIPYVTSLNLAAAVLHRVVYALRVVFRHAAVTSASAQAHRYERQLIGQPLGHRAAALL